nr:hypothetical protein [Tanacetum cinerariifolium]
MEASETRTSSPAGFTSSISPDHLLTQISPTSTPSRAFYYRSTAHMVVRTQPTLSPVISSRVTKAMTLSPSSFHKRYRSSYETSSLSTSLTSSLTLPIWKRYHGTSESLLETETEGDKSKAEGTGSESKESEDEDPGSESEEAAPEGQQKQTFLIKDTTVNEPLGLGYRAAKCHALELAEDLMPITFEVGQSSRSLLDQHKMDETLTPWLPTRPTWVDPKDGTVYIDINFDASPVRALVQNLASPECSSGSLPISLASLTVPSPVASPVTTPASTIAVEDDEFLEVGAHLELQGSILHDHTHRLDALPPTLLEGMGWDITELYDRSATLEERFTRNILGLGS